MKLRVAGIGFRLKQFEIDNWILLLLVCSFARKDK